MVQGRFRRVRVIKKSGKKAGTSAGIPMYIRQYRPTGIHNFKRTFQQVYAIEALAVPALVHHAISWTLASLPNYTEFTALFDAYRITGVKTTVTFNSNFASVGAANLTHYIPNILMVQDNDDATALTAVTQYQEYDKFRLRRIDKPFSIFQRPRIAQSAYGGGVFTSYIQTKGNPWVDCNSASVEYYGLKWVVDTTEPVSNDIVLGTLTLYHKVYLQCKDVR